MTKSETLKFLQKKLRNAHILDMLTFSPQLYLSQSEKFLLDLERQFTTTTLFIVRSSATSEDQDKCSNAGKFVSILNVKKDMIISAIEKVIASYGKLSLKDEVLIQPMLSDIKISGVFFTKDPNTGGNYSIINYDTKGDTTAITSGLSSDHTHVLANCSQNIKNPYYKKLVALSQELQALLKRAALDIEFAFDSSDQLYLFQVRPLILKTEVSSIDQKTVLTQMQARFEKLSKPHPSLLGKRTILGVMPDWNPAEIIGVRPRPLALSLYKELITDSTWAYQRDNYGYMNLRSFPLLIDLMGLPFIDVRVSFNSFVPKGLNHNLAEKLVNYYLDCLENEPLSHDKVEFDIVFSCYTFSLPERIKSLEQYGFSKEETLSITDSLRLLTNNIIHRDKGLWIQDAEKIEKLKVRHSQIHENEDFDELTKIYWLIEECKRYGTLPFAGLARAGFIAVQFLDSMVEADVLSKKQRLDFLSSLNSISTNMAQDLHNLSKPEFLKKYGHLRPGTYDILSPRYDEAPDLYFDWSKVKSLPPQPKPEFQLSIDQMRKIEFMLQEHGLKSDVVGLFAFMKSAIEGREYAKFVFTKTLSDVLSLLSDLGEKCNLTLEDLSYLNIQDLLPCYSSSWDIASILKKSIEEGKKRYSVTKQLNLPQLIVSPEDMESFYLPENKPNFITNKSTIAHVVTNLKDIETMKGSVVFIPSADPGFDWIFSREISGFVTAYGGVNSHMAIRAGEMGLPAVIGAGEKLYQEWSGARKILIDCSVHRVEIVH